MSFQVDVDTQDELDRVWDALLADGGEPVACGWLRDRWGLSWQVTPSMMGELMTGSGDPEANARVFAAMQQMVKLDIPALRPRRRVTERSPHVPAGMVAGPIGADGRRTPARGWRPR